MTRRIFTSTTALVIAAGLSIPANAQTNPGFDITGMSTKEIKEELKQLKSQCKEQDNAVEGVDCDVVTSMKASDIGEAETAAAPGVAVPGVAVPGAPAAEGAAPEADAPVAAAKDGAAKDNKADKAEAKAEAKVEKAAKADAQADAKPKVPGVAVPGVPGQAQAAPKQGAPAAAQDAPKNAEVAPAPSQSETGTAQADAAQDDVKAEDLARQLEGNGETGTESSDAPQAAEGQPARPLPGASVSEGIREQQAEVQAPKPQLDEAQTQDDQPTAQQQADAIAEAEAQPNAAAAASANNGEGDGAEPEVVEEAVTEEDVRSSGEDFATQVGQRPPEVSGSKSKSKDDDDEGLSNFEKAALVGLGTFALSQILGDDATVVENTGDRVVVEENGQYRVLRNDDALLRRPGSDVTTYRYNDGSTRNVVEYDDGTVVETIKAADGRVLRRTRTLQDGETIVLFDDTQQAQDVVVNDLPQTNERERVNFRDISEDDLAAALAARETEGVNRSFSLNQIRNIGPVRHLVPEISVDTINFETNSAAIRADEAQELASLGNAMKRIIADNPSEVFLIEGHTDAVGKWSYNLALSDRRAESVALALTEYFDVPPENMVLQGYGEGDLAIETDTAERGNRRAAVRRITSLLQGS